VQKKKQRLRRVSRKAAEGQRLTEATLRRKIKKLNDMISTAFAYGGFEHIPKYRFLERQYLFAMLHFIEDQKKPPVVRARCRWCNE
jgi:hypothetical protein